MVGAFFGNTLHSHSTRTGNLTKMLGVKLRHVTVVSLLGLKCCVSCLRESGFVDECPVS